MGAKCSQDRQDLDPMIPAVVRVRRRHEETHDIVSLTLDGPADYAFKPGQFNMLYAFGVGEAAISLSGDPSKRGEMVHTIRAVGSVTNALARLKEGDCLGVRGPFGSSWPVDAARGKDVVLITGGIGLAPLRPVIHHCLRERGDYGRLVLLHGVRTPADSLYADELADWEARAGFQVLVAACQADARWSGHVGLVTMLFRYAEFDAANCVVMMCGPEIMMRCCREELEKAGVPSSRTFLSLERNMQCAVGFCGHCQFGPEFICLDGPVFRHDRIERWLATAEA